MESVIRVLIGEADYQSFEACWDFLDIIDDRVNARSAIMAGQLPVEHWHEIMHDHTVADAILDRLIHKAHKLKLSGDTMRKA